MTEEKAKKIFSEIEEEMTNGRGFLRYTMLDLIQFTWFWEKEKTKGKTVRECIKEYIPLMERTTAKQKIENIKNAFRINEDIDEIDI